MKQENQPLAQWVEINKRMKMSKIFNLGLVGTIFVMAITLTWQSFKPPIVVRDDGHQRMYYYGAFEGVTITNDDAKEFIKEFVRLRYVWKKFEPFHIVNNIRPLATDSFATVLYKDLKKEQEKNLKLESIEQTIAGIEVIVEKDKAIATFDKVLRVNGIPLVAPTQISLNIVKQEATRWNPMGLYVHGIVEHSER